MMFVDWRCLFFEIVSSTFILIEIDLYALMPRKLYHDDIVSSRKMDSKSVANHPNC